MGFILRKSTGVRKTMPYGKTEKGKKQRRNLCQTLLVEGRSGKQRPSNNGRRRRAGKVWGGCKGCELPNFKKPRQPGQGRTPSSKNCEMTKGDEAADQ